MHLISIGSSSSGNSTLVYDDTTSILIDCGVSMKEILKKTQKTSFDAVLISHEHSDHIKSAGAVGRKTKSPLYVNDLIVQAKPDLFTKCTTHDINDTSVLNIGSFTITAFSTKHDAKHALGFVVTDGKTKFCYLTDSGSISKTMFQAIKDCNSYFIECDYDEDMMAAYPDYSQELKDRITSNFGHLSTQQALQLVEALGIDRIKVVMIGHLSANTNSPDKVRERIQAKFPNHVDKFIIAPFDQQVEL